MICAYSILSHKLQNDIAHFVISRFTDKSYIDSQTPQ